MTGCAANKTGVAANEHFMPGQLASPWYNRLDEVQCDTLFHAARRAGLKTAACRWPLTSGGADVIDYLVPEVMDADLEAQRDIEKLYRSMCSPNIFEDVVKPRLHLLRGNEHPYDEIFQTACACEIIRRYKPHLLMTHPPMVDYTRHRNGLFNDKVDDALRLTDECIGQIIQAVRDAGIEDTTSYAVVSDHGHLEVKREIAINALFARKGWIQTDAQGGMSHWDVIAHSCGLSAQIYVRDPAMKEAVYSALCDMAEENVWGFRKVFTVGETEARYGLAGDFAFVVETDGFTSFSNEWRLPLVRPFSSVDFHHGRSKHGHRPDVGPQPPMVVCGPAFQKGAEIEKGRLIDEAPTFAAVLGLELKDADGQCMRQLLK